jgi:Metallo-beta-lactamase superfamily
MFESVAERNSSPDAFFVNSFIIEGVRSLVLVDTQFVISEVSVVADRIAAMQKPLGAILITHPHPDHYNGLASILEKHAGTQVYATAGTINGIRETAETKRAYWTPIIGANYPQRFAIPDVIVRDGEHLSIDGVELVVDDFGRRNPPTILRSSCHRSTRLSFPISSTIVCTLGLRRADPILGSRLWLRQITVLRRQRCYTL